MPAAVQTARVLEIPVVNDIIGRRSVCWLLVIPALPLIVVFRVLISSVFVVLIGA
jgi:hypothetical protein